MSAARLMTNLAQLGIRIEAHGDRLRYSPRSALTPDLADRMKAHKGELLAILRADGASHTPAIEPSIEAHPTEQAPADKYDWIDKSSTAPPKPHCRCHKEQRWWRSIHGDHLICGICHPPATPDVMEGLRAADVRWSDDPEAGESDEAIEVIDSPDPCPKCGTLELWQSLAGNWRCLRCDPPTKARRLRDQTARLKTDRTDSQGTATLVHLTSIWYNAVMAKRRTKKMTDQVRQAIDDSCLTRYRIAQETGIDESSLAKFYNGHRGLSLDNLDRLCEYLGLRVVMDRKPNTKGK